MNKKNILYSVLAALLLAVVALVFFAPADFEGKVLQQPDIQQGMANGQEAKAYEEATGEKAYWTGSLFSGMPTFQISPSYSSNKMLEWVVKIYTLWLPSPANLLFAMMLGFFIMCLCMRIKWPYALFGAVAWGFSTYFIIIIGAGHIWKFLTLSYIPPMIGGIVLCYRGKYLYGAALTALFTALQLGSNHPQMTYYFLFVIGALVIAWLITAVREGKIKQWVFASLCVIGAGGLGVCANLASLYMSYEYSKDTIRGRSTDLVFENVQAQPEGLDFDYITQWSYGPGETFTLLIPNVKGGATIKPKGGDMMPLSMGQSESMAGAPLSPEEQYLSYFFYEYFGNQPMTNGPVYVGAFVLVLAVLALFVVDGKLMGPMKWALLAVSILAILLAWGHNFESFSRFFVENVPFYNKFRTPSSMLVVVEFCLPLLAVMAIIKMVSTPDFLKRYGTVFYVVTGFFAFICFLGWVAPGTFGSPWSENEVAMLTNNQMMGNPRFARLLGLIEESRLSMVSADSLRSLCFIILGFLVCYLYLRGAFKNTTVFGCALTAVVLIDLFSVNKRYVDNDSFVYPNAGQEAFEPTPADLEILKDKTPNFRVLDKDNFDQARSSYFHKTIGGYHAAKLTRYNDLLNYELNLKDTVNNYNPQVADMLNARYFIQNGQAIYNPNAFGNAWFVDKVTYVDNANAELQSLEQWPLRKVAVADKQFAKLLGKGRPASAGDYIKETSYAPGRITYEYSSRNGGVAVFSEIFFPWGWEATVDGNPIEIGRVDYVLRALNLPAGKHNVAFEFRPKRLEATNTLGVVSVSLIFLLCAGAIGLVVWHYVKKAERREEKSGEK